MITHIIIIMMVNGTAVLLALLCSTLNIFLT